MRNKFFSVLAVALLSCLAAAQTISVKGTVLDQEGKPFAGARVIFKSLDDGSKHELKVNDKGEFFSLGLRLGTYDVTVVKDGNTIFTYNKVPVTADESKNVYQIDLRKELGAQSGGTTAGADSGGVSTDDDAQSAPAPTGPSAPAAPAPTGGQPARDPNAPVTLTEEQLKKLTPEQRKEYEQYQKTLSENSKIKNLNATLAQAQAASKAGNPDEAVRLVQNITQQAPQHAIVWAVLGQHQSDSARKQADAAARTQRFTEASASFEKALQLGAADPRVRQDLPMWRIAHGIALDGARRPDEALKVFNLAIQEAGTTNPKAAAHGHYQSGAVFLKTGKVDEAVAAFDKAIALDPMLADAYYQKGTALIAKATADKSGKIIAAPGTEDAFQKYLELAPNGRNAQAAVAQLEFLGAKVKTSVRNK